MSRDLLTWTGRRSVDPGPAVGYIAAVDRTRLNDLRKRLYQSLELRAEAIADADRRRWLVNVYDGNDDPVADIMDKIDWSGTEPVALGLAGGSGVGKTTQLYRLIDELWEKDIIGIRVGYEDYSSLSSPPDITDFLLSTVGGLAEEARALGHLPSEWNDTKIQERLRGLLTRLRFEPRVTAGPVNVAVSLREDESFRDRLRAHLSGQVAQLVREVRLFASELASGIQRHVDGCDAVVMIVDSTERLSAPASNAVEMQAAVRNLFIDNGENLRFEALHTVYLMPPWLPISDGGALRLDTMSFPTVRVANQDGTDAPEGLDLLHEIVVRRMPDIVELIARDDLWHMYRMCGGVQRVLFTLLKEVAGRARRASSIPVESEIIKTALNTVAQDYLAITIEAAPALRRVDETKSVDGLEERVLHQLGQYFQALVVLQVANGEKWFTIHPLMRTRLDRI